MLRVVSFPRYENEKKYILDVIFNDFLGIKYNLEFKNDVNATFVHGESGSIEIPDIFFSVDESNWLTSNNMPPLPLQIINGNVEGNEIKNLPVIFGRKNDDGVFIQWKERNGYFGIDILGASFFMLSRYEEYVLCQYRDEYDRFPVEQSLAYKCGFLDRPIINEYVELFWTVLKVISPDIKRRARKYTVIPTHDIDKPFGMAYDSMLQIIRHYIGDIVVRKSLHKVFSRMAECYRMKFLHHKYVEEKMDVFNFILEQSRKYGLKNIFFFMNSKCSLYDGNYTVDYHDVLSIIKRIVSEGHWVGLHPSYVSYNDENEIQNEVIHMNKVLIDNGFANIAGARQHYLKWRNPDTWQFYENSGIPFDSTLTFAGHVGFRCGVCYPFPVYNLVERTKLKLIERPLIVMDGSLYEYMKLSHEEAIEVVKKLAFECKKYNGEFIFLWHNNTLDDAEERLFYKNMLKDISVINH